MKNAYCVQEPFRKVQEPYQANHASCCWFSWIAAIASVQDALASLRIPHPLSFGFRPSAPNNVVVRWLKRVRAIVTSHFHAHCQVALQNTSPCKITCGGNHIHPYMRKPFYMPSWPLSILCLRYPAVLTRFSTLFSNAPPAMALSHHPSTHSARSPMSMPHAASPLWPNVCLAAAASKHPVVPARQQK